MSNVAAQKAVDELKAEQAAQRQCEERMSTMARELKETTVECEFLERDNKRQNGRSRQGLTRGERSTIRV